MRSAPPGGARKRRPAWSSPQEAHHTLIEDYHTAFESAVYNPGP